MGFDLANLFSVALGAILVNNFIFSQFLGICPFMIEVEQGQPAPLVLVDDGEGGAGDPVGDAQAPGQPPGEGGLARPQIPGKGHHRAGLQLFRQPGADVLGVLRRMG